MDEKQLTAMLAEAIGQAGPAGAFEVAQQSALSAMAADLQGLTPEEQRAKIEEWKDRIARRRAASEAATQEIRAARSAKEAERAARIAEWESRSFRWLLEPCPLLDEEQNLVVWQPAIDDPAEVEMIRASAARWKGTDQRQRLEAWLFDEVGELGLDWTWVVMRENGLAQEFIDGIRPAWMDEPAIIPGTEERE